MHRKICFENDGVYIVENIKTLKTLEEVKFYTLSLSNLSPFISSTIALLHR